MLITIVFSNDCNLDCAYCCITNKGTSPILSIDRVFNFLNEMCLSYGEENLIIEFFGGEPTIHWENIKIIIDKYKKPSYRIITNGLFDINNDDIKYWKSIEDIIISIDGYELSDNAGRKINNNQLNKIISNIKYLSNVLNLPVGVGIVIGNRRSLLRFRENINFFSDIGVKYFALEFVTFFNDSTPVYRTYEEMFYFFEELFDFIKDGILNENHKIFHLPRELISGKFFFETFKGKSCNCSVRAISPRGNIYLCRDHAANEESFIIQSNKVKLIGFENINESNILNQYMDDGNNFSHLHKFNTLTPCPAKSIQYEQFSDIERLWWLKDGKDSFQENIIQPIWLLIESYNQTVRDYIVDSKITIDEYNNRIKLMSVGCLLIGEKLNAYRIKDSML